MYFNEFQNLIHKDKPREELLAELQEGIARENYGLALESIANLGYSVGVTLSYLMENPSLEDGFGELEESVAGLREIGENKPMERAKFVALLGHICFQIRLMDINLIRVMERHTGANNES